MQNQKKILIIEDDILLNQFITKILKSKYENVESFTDAPEGINRLHQIQPDLILLNIYIGKHNGLDIIQQLRNDG